MACTSPAAATFEERRDMLAATADARGEPLLLDTIEALMAGSLAADTPLLKDLAALDKALATNHEMDGADRRARRPLRPPGLRRRPAAQPRNPADRPQYPRLRPLPHAVGLCREGRRRPGPAPASSAASPNSGRIPETIAMVLWGTDNLKSEGAQIAQALALIGARPRFDSYGRLAGAELIPLAELGRPRIDVVVTLSGIFRDLLPLQTRMLAEAALLAAQADEPPEMNFVRKHSLAPMPKNMAATSKPRRCASSPMREGAYGANVNLLIDSAGWTDPDELAECFEINKGFAYGVTGKPVQQRELLQIALATVDCTYQNLESVELGITDIDQYVDGLGGISRVGHPRQGRRSSAGLYRRPDARRHQGAHACGTDRPRNPHPHAQPEVVRRPAATMATKACARSKAR